MQPVEHHAPFDLRNQNSFFGGWPVLVDSEQEFSIVISFPVEGWQDSAFVVVSQTKDGKLSVRAEGTKNSKEAIDQALATLSLNVDDADWASIGKQDKVIGNLQQKYTFLRPVLFHSPYEAAAGFIIGQRISIKQRQAIQKRMSEELGESITIDGQTFCAFPQPQQLLNLGEFAGLNPTKLERLHGIAKATLDGKLARKYLLELSEEEALESLTSLNGIGPFYASGILYRGAGIVDGVTDDQLTKYAIQQAYHLQAEPSQKQVLEIAENWKPYRMWCEVLIHIWMRREIGMPKRR